MVYIVYLSVLAFTARQEYMLEQLDGRRRSHAICTDTF